MAKHNQAVTTKTQTAVTVLNPGLPAHLQGYESEGLGVPTETRDFLIPMARVLDPKSPEVEKRGANYVQGAEPGDIYIKNAPIQIIKGEEGFLFQPCYRDEAVVEWLARNRGGGGGGGFVARHPVDFLETSNDVEKRQHPENRDKMIWVRKSSGNMLVETRYFYGYALLPDMPPLPLVLPFASTGHTPAKQWNMLIATKRIPNRAGIMKTADIWLCFYHVATHLRQRGDQAWYLFDITDAGPLKENGLPDTMWCQTDEDVKRGRALYDSVSSGEKKVDDAEAHAESKTDDEIPF